MVRRGSTVRVRQRALQGPATVGGGQTLQRNNSRAEANQISHARSCGRVRALASVRVAGAARRVPGALYREPLRASLADLLAGEETQALLLAYREHGYRPRDIASRLGVHPSTVCRRPRRAEAALQCKA